MTSLDFDPLGELTATLDSPGLCLISDIATNNRKFHLKVCKNQYLGSGGKIGFDSSIPTFLIVIKIDGASRCRWSTNIGEPYLFLKYEFNLLNILDTEKKVLTLKESLQLDKESNI